MKATIKIEMDSAAFEYAPDMELARILMDLAKHAQDGEIYRRLMDYNGNQVGEFEIVNRYNKS